MPPAAAPLPRKKPHLMPIQPVDRPGDNGLGDKQLRRPFARHGIEEAEGRKIRWVVMAIDVLRRLARAPRITADRRVDDLDRDIGVSEEPVPEIPLREVPDAHAPGLHDRSQRPLPDAEPARMEDGPEIRVELTETPLLFFDRERDNDHQSPKKVL
jgi:hypothetical protein